MAIIKIIYQNSTKYTIYKNKHYQNQSVNILFQLTHIQAKLGAREGRFIDLSSASSQRLIHDSSKIDL